MTKRLVVLLAMVLSLAFLAACGSSDDTEGEDAAATTTVAGGGGDQGEGMATVTFTTSDGGSFTLDVTTCDNPAESTVRITARSETADLKSTLPTVPDL